MELKGQVHKFGDDVNTDEIIPARYLTEISKEAMGPHLLENLALEGFDPRRDIPGKQVVVTRANFGCGSSREHAPWALEANGIRLVIAESFARIFKQNMFNCGMMAVELPPEAVAGLFADFRGRDAEVETDLGAGILRFSGGGVRREIAFAVSGFHLALVKAGGWVAYADARY